MATPQQVDEFIQRVVVWAASQPEILSLGLVGSHARGQARESSDIDLVLIATDPDELLLNPGWVESFGKVCQVDIEHYGKVTSLRARYLDGLEIEFGLTDPEWASQPLDPGTRRVIDDGLIVLCERENLLSQLT